MQFNWISISYLFPSITCSPGILKNIFAQSKLTSEIVPISELFSMYVIDPKGGWMPSVFKTRLLLKFSRLIVAARGILLAGNM